MPGTSQQIKSATAYITNCVTLAFEEEINFKAHKAIFSACPLLNQLNQIALLTLLMTVKS